MKKLTLKDCFNFAKILKQSNIKEDITNIADKLSKNEISQEKAGIDIFVSLLFSLGEQGIDNEIFEFLSGPFEMKSDEIQAMELDKVIEQFKILAKENNIVGFFKQAGLLKL